MTEKTEWEIVDTPSSQGERERHGGQAHQSLPPNLQQSMETMLGRWWRWKLAGAAIVMTAALVLIATVAGAVLLVAVLMALASLGVAKLRQWMRR